jgi:hypothetical protein
MQTMRGQTRQILRFRSSEPAMRRVRWVACITGSLSAVRPTLAETPRDSAAGSTADYANRTRLESDAAAQRDRFELLARSRLTVAGFERALTPGPGGAIVTTDALAPFHEALSLSAARVDTPIAKDSLDLQFAAFGQAWAGPTEGMPSATWDVSSAFLTQRLGGVTFSLGRQPVTGGAARYRRLDGVVIRGRTEFGLTASAYYGLTVLPRWDQWYGTHSLGDAYEQWSAAPDSIVIPARGENWMGGMSLGWSDERVGTVNVSFHHQAENLSLADESMGLSFRLGGWSPVGLVADAIYSLAQHDWSDVRVLLDYALTRQKGHGLGLGVRAEVLHTLPAALLAQTSVLSVFAFEQVTEAGGELDFQLPLGMRLGLGGFGQDYGEGDPGARLRATYQMIGGPRERTLVRVVASRVLLEQNGYVQLRASGVFPIGSRLTAYADLYQYFYDEPIRGHSTSTFAAAHLGYVAQKLWNARVGGSASQSPDAALDMQVMAQLNLEWDQEVR